ncbi:MAG: hypothetical protein RL662_2379 [Bacteroidota bacterium]|jgi:hypothetical protein
MKYIAMGPFKDLIKEFCKELEKSALKYATSQEFKTSEYNEYTANELLEAITNEDREEVRATLVCLLHYKLIDRFYQSSAEKQHFTRFKG